MMIIIKFLKKKKLKLATSLAMPGPRSNMPNIFRCFTADNFLKSDVEIIF